MPPAAMGNQGPNPYASMRPTMKAGGSVKKMAEGGKVKRMRYGGSPDDGMDMGQPMRGSAPPPPAPRGGGIAGIFGNRSPGAIAAAQKMLDAQGQMPQTADEKMIKTPPPPVMPPPVPEGPRGIKAGGQVKKMAQGGFTREADGIAKKGKTQGKVVKMAKGGFVKNADGCAQRGKTIAFQVKMKNGGMC